MTTTLEILSEEVTNHYLTILDQLSYEEWVLTIRSKCFYSTDFFAQTVCVRWTSDKKTGKRYKSAPFHFELWELSALNIDVDCIVSRGMAKTTSMKIDTTKNMCFGIQPATLYIAGKGLGEEFVGDIRFEIETNPLIKVLFGNLLPGSNPGESGKKWRQRQLQLANGTELETITKDEPIRGKRPTRVLVDDPQELKDVRNPRIAEEFWIWFFTSVYNALNPEGSSVFVLGTIISENCFVNLLKGKAEAKGFTVVEYPAIKDFETKGFDGELLWPERWTKKMLKERAEKIGMDNFLQEFQNVARPFAGSYVLRNLERLKVVEPIGHYDHFLLFKDILSKDFKYKQLHIGGDFSQGSATSDYQVLEGRFENGDLLFQNRILMPQEQLEKEFDEFILWLMKNTKLNIAINPEVNTADVFMNQAKNRSWFRLMRHRMVYDGFTTKMRQEPGFRTSATTKGILMSCLQGFIDIGMEVTKIQKTEFEKFVFDEKQRMTALPGHHDDTVIAAATACESISRGNPADSINFFG